MVADPKCSFLAQTTSRWSAHWRFAFKPAPAGRGVLGLAPVRVTRSCSAAEAGPRLSQEKMQASRHVQAGRGGEQVGAGKVVW